MNETHMIILDQVSKRYQNRDQSWFAAVEPTSLEIREGEIFGLMGYSGAGKSTLPADEDAPAVGAFQ